MATHVIPEDKNMEALAESWDFLEKELDEFKKICRELEQALPPEERADFAQSSQLSSPSSEDTVAADAGAEGRANSGSDTDASSFSATTVTPTPLSPRERFFAATASSHTPKDDQVPNQNSFKFTGTKPKPPLKPKPKLPPQDAKPAIPPKPVVQTNL